MPGKRRKHGARRRRAAGAADAADLPVRDPAEERYGKVVRMLGNGRLRALCDDGVERLCRIRGNMRRRVWVRAGDTVLVSLRDFGGAGGAGGAGGGPAAAAAAADVVHRYEPAQLEVLRRCGEPVRIATDEDPEDRFVVFENEPLPSDDDPVPGRDSPAASSDDDEDWERI